MKPSEIKPWLKYFDQESLNRSLQQHTLFEQLKESNKDCLSDIALNYYGTLVTYGELIKKIDDYSKAFSNAGIKQGDFVSFYTVTLPETVYALYALNKIGAVCNLIDVRTDAEHTKEFIAKANSSCLVVLDIFFDKIADSMDELGLKKVIVQSAGDSLPFVKRTILKHKTSNSFDSSIVDNDRVILNNDFIRNCKDVEVQSVPYEKDMAAVVTRTGGTTGISKGVILTNDSMNAVYENFRAMFGSMRGESILNFLPLAASYGICVGVHAALCSSLENILIPNFNPDEFPDLVHKYRPNHIVGVPVFYEKLMNSRKMKSADLSFILTMGAGGDTANPTLEKQLAEFAKSHGVKYPLASGYGMSETSSACAFGVKNVHKDGSAGIPSRYSVISIFEPGTTDELDAGQLGEICISGATLMKEYLNEPEETESIMWKHPDGMTWIHSGDIGYIDEDGFLFVKGRIKRSIIRFDGHKNYPVQIEAVAVKHEAVNNCSVIAIKDYDHNQGELPLVIAELDPDYVMTEDPNIGESVGIDTEQLRKEILEFCCNNIEERSKPFDVVIEKLPLTRNGKINIKSLTDKYWDYMSASR